MASLGAPAAHLMLWGARALYLGPAFGLSAHRNAVAVLCVGVGGSFSVAREPGRPEAGAARCRSALIPANTLHQLHIDAVAMAFLYLDPRSADWQVLGAAMKHDHGRFTAGLRGEKALVRVLQALAAREIEAGVARERIAQVLRLPPPAVQDVRIEAAIGRLRAAPHEAHSLAQLAAASALSPSRFLHLFKQVTGVPLRRFRLWNRMGAAVRRIAAGASLTDAALDAGFASSAHFSAAFREMFGMTPQRLAQTRLALVAGSKVAGS